MAMQGSKHVPQSLNRRMHFLHLRGIAQKTGNLRDALLNVLQFGVESILGNTLQNEPGPPAGSGRVFALLAPPLHSSPPVRTATFGASRALAPAPCHVPAVLEQLLVDLFGLLWLTLPSAKRELTACRADNGALLFLPAVN